MNRELFVENDLLSSSRAGPEKLIRYGALLGLGLIGGAIIWAGLLRGRPLAQDWFGGNLATIGRDIAIGLLIGGTASPLLWLFGQHYSGFITIRERIVTSFDLPRFRWWHNALLALIAAIPEEIFFRGAMQAVLGLLLTALVFGILHALTSIYMAYALVAGLALGYLADERGSLWLPVATHFAVDFVSLMILARWSRHRLPEHSTSSAIML